MTKYPEQFKLSVIKRYLSGPVGFQVVAAEFGVGVALVKRWVGFYRARGLDGIKAKPYVRYSAEFKLKVLQYMWDNGLSCARAAAAFDVRGQCYVASWQRRYRAGGVDALMSASEKMTAKPDDPAKPPLVPADTPAEGDNRTRKELLDKIDHLEMEVAYLKKLRALIQSQRQQQPAPRKKRKS